MMMMMMMMMTAAFTFMCVETEQIVESVMLKELLCTGGEDAHFYIHALLMNEF